MGVAGLGLRHRINPLDLDSDRRKPQKNPDCGRLQERQASPLSAGWPWAPSDDRARAFFAL